MIRNRVVSLRDVTEWTDVTDIPDGTTIEFSGGQFVLVPPSAGLEIDARYSNSVNPDTIDAGDSGTANPDTYYAEAF